MAAAAAQAKATANHNTLLKNCSRLDHSGTSSAALDSLSARKPPENKSTRYSQTIEAPLAPMFDWFDRIWRRGAQIGSQGWIAIFTFVLTVFAIIQGVAMVSQNDIMRGQMVQTDKTLELMRLGQRAWVGVVSSEANKFAAEKPLFTQVFIKNTGQTPAFVDGYRAMFMTLKADEKPSDPPYSELFEIDPNIFPRNFEQSMPTDVDVGIPLSSPEYPEDLAQEVADGRRVVYLMGAIFYRDVFEQRRYTTFCLTYHPSVGAFTNYDKYNRMY
jgi:hypothetical protein